MDVALDDTPAVAERFVPIRAAALHALTSAFALASTVEEVANAIVHHGRELFDADGVIVTRLTGDGEWLEIIAASDLPEDSRHTWAQFPVTVPAPLADVVRTGTPMYLESRDAWLARYPQHLSVLAESGHHANMVAPLALDGRVFGALGAAFRTPRTFAAEQRDVFVNMAQQCSLALERARLFHAERVARKAAESANRAKSEFLAKMSHELRTPLNAIDGYAQLMELDIHGPLTDAQRQDLSRIRRSQRTLLGLIDTILNYARVGAGAVTYDITDVPVGEMLRRCEALTMPQARAKGLTTRCTGEEAVTARADAGKLQQIVLNLLTNAIKFTEAGGQIELGCSTASGKVHIRVTDTGCGIPSGELSRVFEPFVQVHTKPTTTAEGVGLGLAISRELARGMRGDLSVQSVVGEGSTFTVTLPTA